MSLLKLQQMASSGKTYYYRSQPAVIKSFDASHPGEIEIIVEINGQPQKFIKENEEKIGLFLACFEEIPVVTEAEEIGFSPAKPVNADKVPDINTPKTEVSLPLLFKETRNMFSELAQGLIADSEKVRTDPSYIPQAKQVCNNVNAIVNIAKLQFQLIQQKQ